MRAIPITANATRTGAFILLRDVSELRRREQELLTKDATIREIHHRVKNNLQTVAALPADVSVLLIEHDMDLVFSFANRMTVLVNGTVLTEGDPDTIANDAQVKAVYLGHGEDAHV